MVASLGVALGSSSGHPSVRLTIALIAVVMTVAAAIVLVEWPFVERAIALEDAPLAWLQSTLLAASAVVCLCRGIIARRAAWYAIAGALFLLAIDERFMGHERLKEWIWLEVFDGDRVRAGRWPDLPVVAELVVGAFVVGWIARESPAGYPSALMWTALAVAAVALAVDLTWEDVRVQVWEELLELLAETLFFVSLLLPLGATARTR